MIRLAELHALAALDRNLETIARNSCVEKLILSGDVCLELVRIHEETPDRSALVARRLTGNTSMQWELLGYRHPVTDWPIPIEYVRHLALSTIEVWGTPNA